MRTILIFLGALCFAALLGTALWWLKIFSNIELGLSAAVLMLGISQVAMLIRQTGEHQAAQLAAQQQEPENYNAQMLELRENYDAQLFELRENAAGWTERINILESEIERVANTRNDHLVAEMKMVETLVKQLAERVAAPAILLDESQPEALVGAQIQGQNELEGQKAKDNQDMAARMAQDAALLNTIRSSLDQNRVDLYLQSIVTLPQRQTRYYEALSRLRDDKGQIIMPDDYMEIAETAGIMPMIDNILLFRCVHVMRKMVERNRDVGVFCNVSALTLLDSEFFPQFIDYMKHNRDLAGSLIFEFGQSTIGGSGPVEFESLKALADLGFTFSMDKVDRLDVDFQVLADMNFQFFKVPAEMFLNDAEQAGSPIQAEDLSELLDRHNISLIVEKIENERSVVNLLDYNIKFGQGYHFSEPRPVRGDILPDGLPETTAA